MCFFLMTLRAERFTSKSLVLVERQKPYPPLVVAANPFARNVIRKKQKPEKPLEENGGKAPGDILPLWTNKSKLLMPKSKACHHPLSEGSHTLQGDKPKKHFVRGEI